VIVADPDPLARRAIRDALLLERGFVVPAEAKDGVEVGGAALHYRPELVLMEVADAAGRWHQCLCADRLARALRACRDVLCAAERETELRALRAGASGFLSKSMSIESVGRARARSRAARLPYRAC